MGLGTYCTHFQIDARLAKCLSWRVTRHGYAAHYAVKRVVVTHEIKRSF